jgi:hypothetical protein
MNSLNIYESPFWNCVCVCVATQLTLCLFHQSCVYSQWLRCNVPFLQYFGIFLTGCKQYNCLRHWTTTQEIPGSIPSRVLGTFTAT